MESDEARGVSDFFGHVVRNPDTHKCNVAFRRHRNKSLEDPACRSQIRNRGSDPFSPFSCRPFLSHKKARKGNNLLSKDFFAGATSPIPLFRRVGELLVFQPVLHSRISFENTQEGWRASAVHMALRIGQLPVPSINRIPIQNGPPTLV